MRLVLQRVVSASVIVEGKTISEIGKGLLCLVGINEKDDLADGGLISSKILTTRLWEDDNGKAWSKNVMEIGGEVLLVSNFTLYGGLKKKKPDYHSSMAPDPARKLFEEFVNYVKCEYNPDKVKEGEFQAYMTVNMAGDGPITLVVDSEEYDNATGEIRKKLAKKMECEVKHKMRLEANRQKQLAEKEESPVQPLSETPLETPSEEIKE
ncbi:hypothetical protein WA158_005233 [Blastocystis sp. Blastoise]